MDKARAQLFDDQLPSLTEADVQNALEAKRIVMSFNALPVPTSDGDIPLLAVKFALGDGTTTTVLLDRYSADLLAAAVNHLQEVGWKVSETIPSGTKPN